MTLRYEPEFILSALSAAIKMRRKELGLSQEDLSSNAGFARSYLSDVERAGRSFSIKNLTRLANCLGMRPSQLLAIAEDQIAKASDQARMYELTGVSTSRASLDFDTPLLLDWMNHSNFGLLITDSNQNDNPIVFASAGFAVFTGYDVEEVVGKNCRFMNNGDDSQPGMATLRRSIVGGQACCAKLTNYKKGGQAFTNLLAINPLRTASQELAGFVGLMCFVEPAMTLENHPI